MASLADTLADTGRPAAFDRRPRKPSRRLRLPLGLVASFAVIVLLAIVAVVVSWQSYLSSRAMLISASDDMITWIRETTEEKVKTQIQPAGVQLDFFARSPLSSATTLPDRLLQVPLMAEVLAHNRLLESTYIGYPNGEFILFRLLRDDQLMRERLGAPEGAALAVQSQTRDETGHMVGEVRFFDSGNGLIEGHVTPAYKYDPRDRPWYKLASQQAAPVLTDPYVFFTTRQPGITLAQKATDGGGIVGLDIRISGLGEQVRQIHITPSTEIAIVNRRDTVVGYTDMSKVVVQDGDGELRLASIGELHSAPLDAANALDPKDGVQAKGAYAANGRTWQVVQSFVTVTEDRKIRLLLAIPNDEFFAQARQLVTEQFLTVGMITIAACGIAWLLTRIAVRPLTRLAAETGKIEHFDFSSDVRIASPFGEIDDLGRGVDRMRRTIRKFVGIGQALAAERDFKSLLRRLLEKTILIAQGDGGAIYMLDEHPGFMVPELVLWVESETPKEERLGGLIAIEEKGIFAEIRQALQTREPVVAIRPLEAEELKVFNLRAMVDTLNAVKLAFVIVPLLDRNQVPFGFLMVTKAIREGEPEHEIEMRHVQLIYAVSGSASVAIQNKQLLEAQKSLIDSLIRLVAGAIDAKSAYTAGHCQRVPVLTRMLAEAGAAQTEGLCRDFKPTPEEWEALDIAAWLHDCGKVTTPEYVVDKATKLETIYDRIHEIRMRFELLKQTAETIYWRAVANGQDRNEARAALEAEWRALDDDFAFIASCNEGGEFMDPARIERIRKIAARRWKRTLSMRLGASYEEKARMERQPEPPLPTYEPLLVDRPDHVVELAGRDIIPPDNRWGFQMKAPKVKYNRGEVYNLSIQRGTLTDEERYRINDHIVQTIIMLESLPFPKHLKNVPELAGGHHEKMDGSGYPKRLKGSDMSIVARMMAIADVFEALTAADRPYKKAKKLSEAVRIMGFMKKDHHLDPDLLDLFLTSGVWRAYAERFLAPEQIDEPDIRAVVDIKPS